GSPLAWIADREMFGELLLHAAATYGPTYGPPPGAPTGTTPLVEGSLRAWARFRRPFPVSSAVPAGSAVRASLPTITSFEAPGSTARSSAAAPATFAADADVPVTETTPPGPSAGTLTPGAAMNVSAPKLEPAHSASFWLVAETPTTFESPAG